MKLNKIFSSVAIRTVSKSGFHIAFISDMDDLSKVINKNDFVFDHFNDATADAFGQENKDQGQDGVREHVLNVRAIAVCYNESTILGFASIKQFDGLSVFYAHGIATRMALQGSGIGDIMIRGLLLDNQGFKFLSLTTQSPVVYCLIRRYCSNIFPSSNYQSIPEDLQEIGVSLMKHRKGSFNPATFTSMGLYSKCLYGHGIPISRDAELNNWFEKSLNVVNGASNDGFLFLGKLK